MSVIVLVYPTHVELYGFAHPDGRSHYRLNFPATYTHREPTKL
jgi:hypothetical protein